MHKYLKSLLALPLLALAATASAETLSSPGSFCRGTTGTIHWDGEFANETSSVASANCPVMTSSAAPVVTRAKVVFRDRSSTQDATCRVTTQWIASDGTVYWYESAVLKSAGYGSGTQTASVAVNFGAIGQNMQFQCQVPARTSIGNSSIFRYEITR